MEQPSIFITLCKKLGEEVRSRHGKGYQPLFCESVLKVFETLISNVETLPLQEAMFRLAVLIGAMQPLPFRDDPNLIIDHPESLGKIATVLEEMAEELEGMPSSPTRDALWPIVLKSAEFFNRKKTLLHRYLNRAQT